jgi:phosphoribosyl 1,2-cyclic phosphodiesterase
VPKERKSSTASSKQPSNTYDGQHQQQQIVTLWGCRGTLPAVGPDFVRYGGQTSCVEIRCVSPSGDQAAQSSIICDAGSGIVKLADQALKRGERVFHILLSHMHYDHIIGLTRFAPLYMPDTTVHFYGLAKEGLSLREQVAKFFSSPFFPVEFRQLPSLTRLHFHEVNAMDGVLVNGCKVEVQALHHPQQAVGYRVCAPDNSTSVCYVTDHEHGTALDEKVVEFIKGTDLFLFDSTYTHEQYTARHTGWGHSSAAKGAHFAKLAGVATYGLFHHDPDSTDVMLEQGPLPEARKTFVKSFLCREGETLHLASLKREGYDKARSEGDFLNFCHRPKAPRIA